MKMYFMPCRKIQKYQSTGSKYNKTAWRKSMRKETKQQRFYHNF